MAFIEVADTDFKVKWRGGCRAGMEPVSIVRDAFWPRVSSLYAITRISYV